MFLNEDFTPGDTKRKSKTEKAIFHKPINLFSLGGRKGLPEIPFS